MDANRRFEYDLERLAFPIPVKFRLRSPEEIEKLNGFPTKGFATFGEDGYEVSIDETESSVNQLVYAFHELGHLYCSHVRPSPASSEERARGVRRNLAIRSGTVAQYLREEGITDPGELERQTKAIMEQYLRMEEEANRVGNFLAATWKKAFIEGAKLGPPQVASSIDDVVNKIADALRDVQINIHVPEAKAPVILTSPTPDRESKSVKVERDSQGRISRLTPEE